MGGSLIGCALSAAALRDVALLFSLLTGWNSLEANLVGVRVIFFSLYLSLEGVPKYC